MSQAHDTTSVEHARVAVVMGSDSDLDCLRPAIETLDRFGVAREARVASAHRRPHEMLEYGTRAAGRGATHTPPARGPGAWSAPGLRGPAAARRLRSRHLFVFAGLGAQVELANEPFEPESGAYGGHVHGPVPTRFPRRPQVS